MNSFLADSPSMALRQAAFLLSLPGVEVGGDVYECGAVRIAFVDHLKKGRFR